MQTFEIGAPNCGFILSEANGHLSRENGIVASGQGELPAGTVVMLSGSKLVIFSGEESTAGGSNEAEGIIMYKVDATSEDVPVAYIARNAEVNVNGLNYPEANTAHPGGEIKANVIASLKLRNIIVRQ